MTPGPARRIVTLLPRNSPTPMAPPIASIVSCRCVSLRFSSPASRGATYCEPSLEDCGVCLCRESEGSAMLCQIEQGVTETMNLIDCVVVDQGGANNAAFQAHVE